MEKRGVVSHAAALKMKEQLDIEYETQKMLRMMAQNLVEEQLTASQLKKKQVATKGLQSQEAGAEAHYETAATTKAANDAKMEAGKKKIQAGEDAKKSLRETGVDDEIIQQLNELFTKLTGKDSGSTSLPDQFNALAKADLTGTTSPTYSFGDRYDGHRLVKKLGSSGDINLATYEGANIDIAMGKQMVGSAGKKAVGLEIAEGNSKSDLEAARHEMEKNRDQIRELQDKLAEKQSVNAIKEAGAQSDIGLSRANSALTSDRATAAIIQAGQRGSAGDEQQMMADASRIAGHAVNLETAAKIISNGATNISTFMAQVDRLAQSMSQMSPAETAALKSKIDAMQRQINTLAGSLHR